MKLKKILKDAAIFAVMMLIVGANVAPASVKASSSFGFGFDFDGDSEYTDAQRKTTYSSVRMTCTNCDSSGAYYYARVYGVDGENKFDYSHGYEYYFEAGYTHDMLNWVKENSCDYAAVRGVGYAVDDEYGTVFTGTWYPDI